jgi:hypothetical protein
MAIDISKMKAKLSATESKGDTSSKVSTFWKPVEGEQDIRIVCPSDGDPFRDFHFHYLEVGGKRKTVLCLKKNFGEQCPICEFASQTWRDGVANNDDEDKKLAKSLFVKERYFSPVLVRGEEDKGIRVWGYGGTVYKKLLSLVLNPDYGDITDTEEGTDLTISYSTKTGRMFAETDVAPRRKTSVLCSKAIGGSTRCAELLESMPSFDSLFERLTAQQITNLLDEFLSDQNGAGPEVQKYNANTSSDDDLLNSVFREISAASK